MVEENIGGNRVVKAFSQEPYEIEKFNKHNEDYKNGIWLPQMSLKIFTVVRRFCGSLNVIALVLGGLFVIQGRMTIGDLVAFNGFLWMLNMPMRMSGG